MEIGISGATGFVGSHLVRHFAKEGHKVKAYGRTTAPKQLLNYAQYEQWDLTKPHHLNFNGDIFIHCAGFVDLWGDYMKMQQITVEGTKQSLQIAKNAKHFIYISSGSVYGSIDHNDALKENAPYPNKYGNIYAKTKMEAELQVKEKSHAFKQITILRPHFIYGPNDRTLIPRLMNSIKFGNAFMVGNGKNKISPTHIGNICHGLSLIVNSKQKGLKIYNITDKTSITLNNVYEKLINAFKLKITVQHLPYFVAFGLALALEVESKTITTKAPLFTRDIAKQFTNTSILSIEHIANDLDYNPQLKMTEGFEDLASWVESVGGVEEYLKKYRFLTWKGNLITY